MCLLVIVGAAIEIYARVVLHEMPLHGWRLVSLTLMFLAIVGFGGGRNFRFAALYGNRRFHPLLALAIIVLMAILGRQAYTNYYQPLSHSLESVTEAPEDQ